MLIIRGPHKYVNVVSGCVPCVVFAVVPTHRIFKNILCTHRTKYKTGGLEIFIYFEDL